MISNARKFINDFFKEKPLVYHNFSNLKKYDHNKYILGNITLIIYHDNFLFHEKYSSGKVDSSLKSRYFNRIAKAFERNIGEREIDFEVLKNAKSANIEIYIGTYDRMSRIEFILDVGLNTEVEFSKCYGSFPEVLIDFEGLNLTWYIEVEDLFTDVLRGNIEMHVEEIATETRQIGIELVKEKMGEDFNLDEKTANDLVISRDAKGFIENRVLFLKRKW